MQVVNVNNTANYICRNLIWVRQNRYLALGAVCYWKMERKQEKKKEKIKSERNALAEHWAGLMPLSTLSCRSLSVTISLCLSLILTHYFHTFICFLFIFTSCLLICHIFGLCSPLLFTYLSPNCSWLLPVLLIPTCVTTSGVVLEMLSRPEEVGFPDLVTVMRNLSTDSGMPTLPPGGGLASK